MGGKENMLGSRVKKALLGGVLFIFPFLVFAGTVFACPELQLDISGGNYSKTGGFDGGETTLATGNSFYLYALINPSSRNDLSDYYYISMAVLPKMSQTTPSPDLGSFSFAGNTINVTEDMVYGVPPIENSSDYQTQDAHDLPSHGVFETYFSEHRFQFQNTDRVNLYNVAENPGDPIINPNGALRYAKFLVDTSDLDDGYVIHFDLYNEKVITIRNGRRCIVTDVDVENFAPFSKDAESMPNSPPTPAPEPSTMLLLGSGLSGLFTLGSLKKRKLRLKKADD